MNTNISKIKISELGLLTSITPSQTIVPVSTGSPLSTKGILINDLIKDTSSVTSKANLAGGNTFTGMQYFNTGIRVTSGGIDTNGMNVGSINFEPDGDGIWSDDVHVLTRAQLLYLSGLTANVQSQLNSKVNLSGNSSIDGSITVKGYFVVDNQADHKQISISPGTSTSDPSISSRESGLGVMADEGDLILGTTNSGYVRISPASGSGVEITTSDFVDISTGDGVNILSGPLSVTEHINCSGNSYVGGNMSFASTSNIVSGSIGLNLAVSQLLHLIGVTSNIQTQLDSKIAPSDDTTFTGENTFSNETFFNAGFSINADIIVHGNNDVIVRNDDVNTSYSWNEIVEPSGIVKKVDVSGVEHKIMTGQIGDSPVITSYTDGPTGAEVLRIGINNGGNHYLQFIDNGVISGQENVKLVSRNDMKIVSEGDMIIEASQEGSGIEISTNNGGDINIEANFGGQVFISGRNSMGINPYRTYSCILNQESTNDPIVTVLQNDFDADLEWSRISTGKYRLTASSAAFTEYKTVSPQSMGVYRNEATPTDYYISANRLSSTAFELESKDLSTGVLTDGLISLLYVEIRVYN
jgi:hypothetical protein